MRLLPQSVLGRNIGWMFLGQGLGYALRALYFIFVARLLGVVQYGIVVGAFAFVNLVAQYSRLGSGMVLLRYVSADHKKFPVYWGSVLAITSAVSGLLILALRLVAPLVLGAQSVSIVLALAVGSCLCEQLTVSATQVFQAFEKASITALFNQLTSLARTLMAAAMLLVMHHATAGQWAFASAIVSAVAAASALVTVTVYFGRPQFSPKLTLQRAGEGIEYAFAASTTSAYDDIDKTMLSHYGMNAANGIYAMAYRIIEIATSPVASVQLAAEPRLFQLGSRDLGDAAALGHRLLKRALPLTIATAIVMFVCAPLLPLVVGKSFAEGVSALRWLCVIPIFRSVHYITGSVLTCAGYQRYRTVTQVIAATMNFGLNLWFIPRYGWHGAAWVSLLTDGLLGLMNWTVLERTRSRIALGCYSPSISRLPVP